MPVYKKMAPGLVGIIDKFHEPRAIISRLVQA